MSEAVQTSQFSMRNKFTRVTKQYKNTSN